MAPTQSRIVGGALHARTALVTRDSAHVPPGSEVPDVAIIVPVYNGADTIAACVRSLLALHYPHNRRAVIVVDNNSTDATLDILHDFGDEITVLREVVRGAAAARNCGIRHTRASLIAFTDADAEADPGWLRALIPPLNDVSVGIVGGRILASVGGNRIERFGEAIHDHARAIHSQDAPYAMSGNWASRAEVLRGCGLFDESLLRGQDVDLAWRIHRAGFRLVYAPAAVIRHHNERTIRGLMHEGYVHGFHRVSLLRKHAGNDAIRSPRSLVLQRLRGDLRRFRSGDVVDGLLWLLFNFGKSLGERAGRRAARRQS